MKTLYMYRNDGWSVGIAKYEQIEGDIFKDTSCNDHDNCIVKIEDCGEAYYIIGLENEEAKRKKYYHPFDTPLFEDQKDAELWGVKSENKLKFNLQNPLNS